MGSRNSGYTSVLENPRDANASADTNYCTWRKEVKDPKTFKRNVLLIPSHVVTTCDLAGIVSIMLFDTDTSYYYNGEVHTYARNNNIEKYVCRGWYELVKEKKLDKGDVVEFSIRYPPGNTIQVSVLNR
ncbi:uncharacterized protein LOC131624786 [Vicia villosa]|uniref:uncharacterized protein LOC131624786 n=1 Tax=Vicia villosa TaxID=3911 RepID=UPI00273BD204|nr:uncharacterized protein LOC131624786 [Vicia villosa]